MSGGDAHDETRELASLYALGALSDREAHSFEEHVAGGCERCKRDLDGYSYVAWNLALAAPAAEPPAGVLESLLRMTAQPATREEMPEVDRPATLLSILGRDREWIQVAEGIQVKQFFVDEASGIQTSLVKMAPGASLPAHRHTGVEQVFILEGDCNLNGEVLGPGDYHRAEGGSIHEITRTTNGTLFLLVAPAGYEVLSEPRDRLSDRP